MRVCLFIFLLLVFNAEAGELWVGLNYHHLSQLDAGPPFNEDEEDSVDHLGVHLTLRDELAEGWEYYMGASFGRNYNMSGCCWDDGGAEVDTLLFIGVQKKIFSW